MKKFFVFISAGVLAISLAACGSSQDVEPQGDDVEVEFDVTYDDTGTESIVDDIDEIDKNENVVEYETLTSTAVEEDGNLSFVGFKIYEPDDYGYTYYDILVKNETDETINTVSVDVEYLDNDNNIIDTSYPQTPVRVLPNQTLAINGLIETGNADYVNTTGYAYYTESDDFVSGQFEQIPDAASLTESGEYFENEESVLENNAIDGPIMTNAVGDLTVENLEVGEVSGGYIYFYADVRNNTDDDIHYLGVNFTFLDEKGNIAGETYPQVSNVIQPGQQIRMEGLALTSEYEYVTVDGYSYYNGNDEFFSGFFSEIPQAVSLN